MLIYLSTAEPGIFLPTLTYGNLCMTHTELPITTINPGFFFVRFLGKCKQVFVRDFELDNFLDELDKNFQ